MQKLNLGSYTVMFNGWLNIDILNHPEMYARAAELKCAFMSMDLSKGIPFESNTIDLIFTSHFVEHLSFREAEYFMEHCYRILKPGGTIRVAVPDLRILVNMYQRETLKELDKINEPSTRANYDVERFWEVLTAAHKSCYDWESMWTMCHKAGFPTVERKSYQQGHPTIIAEAQDLFPEVSLYVECTK